MGKQSTFATGTTIAPTPTINSFGTSTTYDAATVGA